MMITICYSFSYHIFADSIATFEGTERDKSGYPCHTKASELISLAYIFEASVPRFEKMEMYICIYISADLTATPVK